MEEDLIKAKVASAAFLSKSDRLRFYTLTAFDAEPIPYTDAELALATRLTDRIPSLFHGGESGFQAGDRLLPSYLSGMCSSENSAKPYVYMTAHRHNAAHYAWRRKKNTGRRTSVYAVIPDLGCLISNTSVRLRRLLMTDGSFGSEQIEAVTYLEYVSTGATILSVLEDRPAMHY